MALEVFKLFGSVSINKTKALSDLNSIDHKAGGLSKTFGKIGKVAKVAFAAAGVAAAGIFVAAIKTAAEFEQSMAMVKSVTGATGEEFDALTAKAKQLGKDTKFSMTEIASGMEFLGRAGFDAKEIIDAMGGVTALAASQMMDLGRAADITSNVLTGFGLAASESDRVANILAATAASANVNVEMMGESFKYFAPIAKTFGISIEESAAIIGKLGDAGLQGSMATRVLGTALTRLTNPTSKMQKAMDDLNLSFFDAKGTFIGFTPMIAELQDRFKGLTDQQKMAALSTLFGAQAVKQMSVLVDVGSDKLDAYTQSITGTNAAIEQMNIQNDTLLGQWTLLKGSISLLLQTIGEDMMPILKDALKNVIIPWVNGVAAWIEKMGGVKGVIGHALIALGEWIKGVAEWIQAHEYLRKSLDSVMDVIKGLWSFVKDVFRGDWSAAWQDVKQVVVGTAGVIINLLQSIWDALPIPDSIKTQIHKALDGILSLVKDVFEGDWKAAWQDIKNVAVAMVSGMVASIKEIWKALPIPDATKQKIVNVLNTIKNNTVAVFAWIKDRAIEAWKGIKESVGEHGAAIIAAWDSVKDAAGSLWSAISNIFASIMGAFGKGGQSAVTFKDVVKGAFDIILTVVTTALNGIADLFNILGDALRGDWSQVWIDFKKLISDIWGGIVKTLDIVGLTDTITAGWESMRQKTANVLTAIKDTATKVFSWIKARAIETWQGIKESVVENGGGIIDALGEVWDAIKELAKAFADAFAEISSLFSGGSADAVSFKDAVKVAFDLLLSVITTTLKLLAGGLRTFADAVRDVGTVISALLKGDWEGAWNGFKAFFIDYWNNLKAQIKIAWDGIVKVLDIIGLKDILVKGWEDIKTATVNIWESIKTALAGVWDGIKSWFAQKLQDLVDTVTGWMPGWMKKWLGVGEQASSNLAIGLNNKTGEVKTAAGNVKTAALDGATPTDQETQEIGHKTAEGIAKGLTDAQAMAVVTAGAQKLTEEQIKALNEAAGIQSPAKKFMPTGEAETAGIIKGMLALGNKLIETGNKLVTDTTGPMKETAKQVGKAVAGAFVDGWTSGVEESEKDFRDSIAAAYQKAGDVVSQAHDAQRQSEADFRNDLAAAYTTSQDKTIESEKTFRNDLAAAYTTYHSGAMESEAEFRGGIEAAYVKANNREEAAQAAHDAKQVKEVKTFWQTVKETVDKGTQNVGETVGNWLNGVKSTLSNGLGDMLVDIVHFGKTHSDEEEAHLQRIADINKDYDERIRNASAEDRAKLEADRQAALAKEEQDYQNSRTTITGIISKGFSDMANAILNSALKSAVDTAVNWLWGLVTGSQAVSTAVTTTLSGMVSSAGTMIASIGASLGGLGTILAGLAGIAVPIMIGTSDTVANWVHDVNVWLNNLFGQHQAGDTWQQDGQTWHQVPAYDIGGIVPGPIGSPQPAIVHGGEVISPPGQAGVEINISFGDVSVRDDSDITELSRQLGDELSWRMRGLGLVGA